MRKEGTRRKGRGVERVWSFSIYPMVLDFVVVLFYFDIRTNDF